MFLKITLITSLVNICSCATPTYPEGKSNQAVYSQSFTREDVPLSYEYSAVHIYAPNQKRESAQKVPKTLNTEGIQYAPLPVQYSNRQEQNKAGLYTQVTYKKDSTQSSPLEELTESTGKITHLEPKLVTSKPTVKNSVFPNQYIPGHNIHILQSSDRSPSAYNRYSITPPTEKQNMGHYLEQFSFYEEPQKPSASTTHRPKVVTHEVSQSTESPKLAHYTFVPKPQPRPQIHFYMKDSKLPLVDQGQAALMQMYSAKVPQVQLNIGREYKFPLHQQRLGPPHLSPARFYAYPVNPYPFVNRTKKTPSDTVQLQPLANHLHLSAYSRT